MCGIIGFTGYLDASKVLIDGLSELEYRGYDSAGIACFCNGSINIVKSVGKVVVLKQQIPQHFYTSSCGIGHTRWATHGGVSKVNAHPHSSGKVTLIHNGIIENYHELWNELHAIKGDMLSQTDSEIAAMLIDSLYDGDAYKAIKEAVNQLTGTYALCIMFSDQPDIIYCIRKGSPLVACTAQSGSIVASDIVALLRYSKDYFVLPENHIAKLSKDSIIITDFNGNESIPELLSVTWDVSSAQKNGYKHYMEKEIHEQPDSLKHTITPRLEKRINNTNKNLYCIPDFTSDKIPDSLFEGIDHIVITACGTALHAGYIGRILFERLLRLPTFVEIASEFRYQDPILSKDTLVITISQSGETADTLAALLLAKEYGARTISIVNVKGSSIARESDYVLYTHAGPEIAVASTKAYTAQLAALYMLVFRFAYISKCIDEEKCSCYMNQLTKIIPHIEDVLKQKEDIKAISKSLVKADNLFFIGKGLDYALSCEGSIKLKEITYIHSEAYAAGELKHGTLSLITDGIPVIGIATQKNVLSKMISSLKEVRARGALVICITSIDADIEKELYDYRVNLPHMEDDIYYPYTAAIVLQLIAYYTSSYRGLDVDQPRNLAKSVTVE